MTTKIEITQELVEMINLAVKEWKTDPNRDPDDKHFDLYCEEMFGLTIDFAIMGHALLVEGAKVSDDNKYINFLLRFGNMHDKE